MSDIYKLLIIRFLGVSSQFGVTFLALSHFGAGHFGNFIQLFVLTNLIGIPVQSGLTQSVARYKDSLDLFVILITAIILFLFASFAIVAWLVFFVPESNILSYFFIVFYSFFGSVHALLLGISRKLGDAISGVLVKQFLEPLFVIFFILIASNISLEIGLKEIYILSSLLSLLFFAKYFKKIFNLKIDRFPKLQIIKISILGVLDFSKISLSSHIIFSMPVLIISSFFSSSIVSAWRILEQLAMVVLLPHSVFSAIAHRDVLKEINEKSQPDSFKVALDSIWKLRNIGLILASTAFTFLLLGNSALFNLLSSNQISWEQSYFYIILVLMFAHLLNTGFGHLGILLGVIGDENFMAKTALTLTIIVLCLELTFGRFSMIMLAICPLIFNFLWNNALYLRVRSISS